MSRTNPDIVVPVLTARTAQGGWDAASTARYAQRAVDTWIDRFIVSGSTTAGHRLAPSERKDVLDLWLDHAPAERLVACCWCEEDIANALELDVVPMAVLGQMSTTTAALAFLGRLPAGAYIYGHPAYGAAVFDGHLARSARAAGVTPAGAKLSKVTIDELAGIRQAVGGEPVLWDGSSRHIKASVEAGANGVIATPLACLPTPFPTRSTGAIQAAIDAIQAELDQLLSRDQRSSYLLAAALGREPG